MQQPRISIVGAGLGLGSRTYPFRSNQFLLPTTNQMLPPMTEPSFRRALTEGDTQAGVQGGPTVVAQRLLQHPWWRLGGR